LVYSSVVLFVVFQADSVLSDAQSDAEIGMAKRIINRFGESALEALKEQLASKTLYASCE
jgi:hypothetical protein